MTQVSFRTVATIVAGSMLFACDVDFDVDAVVDRAAIKVAKDKWHEQDIHDYTFVYTETCTCEKPDSTGVRVDVRADKAIAAVGDQSGIPFGDFAVTIDDLFDRVLAKSDDGADDLDVHFDQQRRFIDRVTLDPDEKKKGDEYGFTIPCFSPEDTHCEFPLITEDDCKLQEGVVTPLPMEKTEEVCTAEGGTGAGQVERDISVCCVPN